MIEIIITVVLITLPFLVWKLLTRDFDYWKKRNVANPTPLPLVGNYGKLALGKTSLPGILNQIYDDYPNEPYVGAFLGTAKTLIIRDPEILKMIMTKDFYYFYGRGITSNSESLEPEPLTQHLFAVDGDLWRVLRQNLTPLFSSAKMKKMFYLMDQCGKHFESYVENRLEVGNEFEMRDIMSRFTMDVIGTCAFGLNMNTMEDEDSEFRKIGKKLFQLDALRIIRVFVRFASPSLFNKLGLSLVPSEITNFFRNLSKEVIESREGSPAKRHDFVDLLAELKRNGYIEGDGIESMKPGMERKKLQIKLDDDILAAQMVVFFLAGYETSSTTMSYALHELAINPDVQNRLQSEIDGLLIKYDGEITYELIQEASYLDKVISETGRKYPVLMALTRECSSNYTLPDGLVIEKGVKIHIPVYGLHHDPKYYPNPELFDPERFDRDVIDQRPSHTYLPFGEGQRLCIGMRFGKLQVSVGLITILRRYNVERCSKTHDVIDFNPRSAISAPKHGIWLKLVPKTV